MREERISLRMEPVIDQRFDEISKEAVEQDQDRQALVSKLVTQIMGAAKKEATDGRMFPR